MTEQHKYQAIAFSHDVYVIQSVVESLIPSSLCDEFMNGPYRFFLEKQIKPHPIGSSEVFVQGIAEFFVDVDVDKTSTELAKAKKIVPSKIRKVELTENALPSELANSSVELMEELEVSLYNTDFELRYPQLYSIQELMNFCGAKSIVYDESEWLSLLKTFEYKALGVSFDETLKNLRHKKIALESKRSENTLLKVIAIMSLELAKRHPQEFSKTRNDNNKGRPNPGYKGDGLGGLADNYPLIEIKSKTLSDKVRLALKEVEGELDGEFWTDYISQVFKP